MKPDTFDAPHDPRDPNPWLANYLDQSTPLDDAVKRAWLADSASGSRQYLLPIIRPLARTCIVLMACAASSRLASRSLRKSWGSAVWSMISTELP